MKIGEIEKSHVLPSPRKVLLNQMKKTLRNGKRPKLTLKDLAKLRQYKDHYDAIESERPSFIRLEYGDYEED